MMIRILAGLLALGLLAGCDGGSPLQSSDDTQDGGGSSGGDGGDDGGDGGDGGTDGGDGGDGGEPIDSSGVPLPGTDSPSPSGAIFRREAPDAGGANTYGNGFARNLSYDSDADTFYVDGLAFDGDQPGGTPFERASPGTLGGYALYEAPQIVEDLLSQEPIAQFPHRALYGASDTDGDGTPETEFAVVRTGAYVEYGFGGFVYQRNGGVVLPTEGQATYRGDYAGLRDFTNRGGLEYVAGDIEMTLDIGAFEPNCSSANCGTAVRGYVRNRRLFDTDGNDVTQAYLDAYNADAEVALSALPTLQMRVGPGVADGNGELTGEVYSQVGDSVLESGNYYALMSGDHTQGDGGQIVGIIVVDSADPRFEGSTVRETGGFIADQAPSP